MSSNYYGAPNDFRNYIMHRDRRNDDDDRPNFLQFVGDRMSYHYKSEAKNNYRQSQARQNKSEGDSASKVSIVKQIQGILRVLGGGWANQFKNANISGATEDELRSVLSAARVLQGASSNPNERRSATNVLRERIQSLGSSKWTNGRR